MLRSKKDPPEVVELHNILDHGAADIIAEAVRQAELKTTAEIMVRLAATSPKGPIRTIAEGEFVRLGLAELELGNGVLLYVALDRHAVEIVVGPEAARLIEKNVWQKAVDIVAEGFRTKNACNGIVEAVELMAAPLAQHFPPDGPDRVNLPDVAEDE